MSEPKLPPMRWIASTLATTTETLARELDSPSAVRPEWSEPEWRVAQAAAAIHGISPLLASRLRWRGPSFWNEFLYDQREQTRSRHARIATLLESIDTAARSRGIAVVALKGAALHARGVYRADERPMSDVDLLVRPQDRAAAASMIESLDYRASCETWKHLVFAPITGCAAPRIGEHADNPIKIELHTAIAEQMPRTLFDITHLIQPSATSVGVNCYSRPAGAMAHLLLHAAGAIVWRSLRALHLHDIALLARSMGASDWWELASMQCNDDFWWAHPPLALVETYFPGSIPVATLHTAKSMCPSALRAALTRRRLADVSISAPYVHAFPGIEWARSFGEIARYMRDRVQPNAEVREARKHFSDHQSLGEDIAWVRQSQLERIARFLVGHPTRVQTIATVRAALRDR